MHVFELRLCVKLYLEEIIIPVEFTVLLVEICRF